MSKDDTAVKEEEVLDTSTTDSAPEETKESKDVEDDFDKAFNEDMPESTKSETDSKESKPEPKADTEAEDDAEIKADETEDEGQTAENEEEPKLAPKSQNRFQQLANENREMKEQLETLKAKEAQIANEQELISEINPNTGEYYSPQEIEQIAFSQAKEQQAQAISQQRYELEVQQNQRTIADEANQVLELPIFNSNDKDFDQDVASEYEGILLDNLIYAANDGNNYSGSQLVNAGVNLNDTNQVRLVGSNISPLKLARLVSNSSTSAAKKAEVLGQAKAQKATEKMQANADVIGGSSSTTKQTDDFLQGFNTDT